jgi:hypothetical protein
MKKPILVLWLLAFLWATLLCLTSIAFAWSENEKFILRRELSLAVVESYIVGDDLTNINTCEAAVQRIIERMKWKYEALEINISSIIEIEVYACRLGYLDRLLKQERLLWMINAIDECIEKLP